MKLHPQVAWSHQPKLTKSRFSHAPVKTAEQCINKISIHKTRQYSEPHFVGHYLDVLQSLKVVWKVLEILCYWSYQALIGWFCVKVYEQTFEMEIFFPTAPKLKILDYFSQFWKTRSATSLLGISLHQAASNRTDWHVTCTEHARKATERCLLGVRVKSNNDDIKKTSG